MTAISARGMNRYATPRPGGRKRLLLENALYASLASVRSNLSVETGTRGARFIPEHQHDNTKARNNQAMWLEL